MYMGLVGLDQMIGNFATTRARLGGMMVLNQIDHQGDSNFVGPPFCRPWRQNGGPTKLP